jgi:hypothetical protein
VIARLRGDGLLGKLSVLERCLIIVTCVFAAQQLIKRGSESLLEATEFLEELGRLGASVKGI